MTTVGPSSMQDRMLVLMGRLLMQVRRPSLRLLPQGSQQSRSGSLTQAVAMTLCLRTLFAVLATWSCRHLALTRMLCYDVRRESYHIL